MAGAPVAPAAVAFGKTLATNAATRDEIARNTSEAAAMRSHADGGSDAERDLEDVAGLEGRPIRGMGVVEYRNAPFRIRLPQLRTTVRVPDACRPDAVVSVLRERG